MDASVDQRLTRLDQALRDEPNLVSSKDREIRDRLKAVEELKQQVKVSDRMLWLPIEHSLFA